MDLVRATVTGQRRRSCRDTHVIDLACPSLAQAAQPGQFVHIRCGPSWEPLLRRPMSIFRIGQDGVSLMVRAVGEGSAIIAASPVGAELGRARAARAAVHARRDQPTPG